MTTIFGNLKTDGLEESKDRLGGYAPLETDIYLGTIKTLYAGESKNGAMSVTAIVALDNGQEYRETLYITNRQRENFYKTEEGKKAPLPGFVTVNDLCLITTEKELSELSVEEKVLNIWDPDQKKELPKSVPVITEAIGKRVALGIVKQTVNKNEKNDKGEYVPTAESRDENIIDKVFHPDAKVTVNEARERKTEPKFWDAWVQRNRGKTRDRRTIKDGGGAVGAPPKAGAPASGTPRKSLFGK